MTSLPVTSQSSRPANSPRSRSRSFGEAMFTGISSGNRLTFIRSATLIEAICLRRSLAMGCLLQENSSIARKTSKPRSSSSRTMCLCPVVKGSKVPGKKAAGRGGL